MNAPRAVMFVVTALSLARNGFDDQGKRNLSAPKVGDSIGNFG